MFVGAVSGLWGFSRGFGFSKGMCGPSLGLDSDSKTQNPGQLQKRKSLNRRTKASLSPKAPNRKPWQAAS